MSVRVNTAGDHISVSSVDDSLDLGRMRFQVFGNLAKIGKRNLYSAQDDLHNLPISNQNVGPEHGIIVDHSAVTDKEGHSQFGPRPAEHLEPQVGHYK